VERICAYRKHLGTYRKYQERLVVNYKFLSNKSGYSWARNASSSPEKKEDASSFSEKIAAVTDNADKIFSFFYSSSFFNSFTFSKLRRIISASREARKRRSFYIRAALVIIILNLEECSRVSSLARSSLVSSRARSLLIFVKSDCEKGSILYKRPAPVYSKQDKESSDRTYLNLLFIQRAQRKAIITPRMRILAVRICRLREVLDRSITLG
jgi:hypothetical protein